MPVLRSSFDEKGKGTAVIGEKHLIKHESPEGKRIKAEEDGNLRGSGSNLEEKFNKKDDPEDEASPEVKSSGEEDDAVKPSQGLNMSSNVLEKGIVYFFIRGRVNIEEPESVNDIARSYMLLRPIPKDAKLGKGPIGDFENTRVLVLPKKTFPTSPKDRFMAFVDMSKASYQEIKDDFLASSQYVTKTVGTRHIPQATPIAEAVYMIISTGRESHFAYKLTLPQKLDEVQRELGLKRQGSFIISTKSPKYPGPASARLPKGPEYPKDVLDDFRDLRWMPLRPVHLNYANTQILLIGERSGIEKATEPQDEEQEKGKDTQEALEKLEEDDLDRMQHLGRDESESIFADLHVHAKDYPALQTTF